MKTTEQPTEGLHRSLRQLLARAPNGSPAFLSCESRLPALSSFFSSPETLAQLASQNEDLSSRRSLVLAVAQLVGGKHCVPCSDKAVTHAQGVQLLYHTDFKYDRGVQTALVLPNSDAQRLRANKCFVSSLWRGGFLFVGVR